MSTYQQQQQGLAPLNPNSVSGNSMMMYGNNSYNNNASGMLNNISPIMPNCSSSSQDMSNSNSNNNQGDASINSVDTTKTASSFISNGGTHYTNSNANANRQVRRRKYTHNPYAASSSAASSSRASSVCSTDNSTPSTPMNSSFADGGSAMMGMNTVSSAGGYHGNQQIAAVAAAGGYNNNSNNNVVSTNNSNNNSNSNMMMMNGMNTQQDHMMAMMNTMNMNMNMNNNMMNNNNHHQHNTHHQRNNNNRRGQHNNNNNNNNNMDMMMLPNNNSNNNNVQSLKSATEQFDSMRGSLVANSCNARGRHVVVAMIRLQQPEYNDALFDELSQGWGQLVSDMNCCHVARTFVESFPSEKIQKLAEVLSREVVLHMCSASQYSRRVLQTMFETHSSFPYLQAVVDHVASGAVALATTQQGCISVMRVLEFSKPDQREKLMAVLSPHLAALAADPYGNYVLQTITQALGSNEQVCNTLEKAFDGSWVALSCNKFASNVMEKIINISAETPACTARKTIIEELVCNNSHLSIIIVDNFGNFVLQAIIDSCHSLAEFRKIGDRVRPLLASSPYGHKIEGKLKAHRCNNSSNNNGSNNNTRNSRSSSQDNY